MGEKGDSEVYEIEPVITEKRVWNERNIMFALILTILLISVEFISVLLLELSPFEAAILGFLLLFLYAIVLFFLIEPTLIREIKHSEIRTIGPKEILRTVEKPIIRTVERPVIQEVEKRIIREVPVPKKVYVSAPKKKISIPKYKFIGSTETKTYHKKSCRLGKLIKRKYKLSSNDENYFKRKHFEPCKVCLKKQVKDLEKKKKVNTKKSNQSKKKK